MSKTKTAIYKFLKLINDLSAISKGRTGKRIGRRTTGKIFGKAQRKL